MIGSGTGPANGGGVNRIAGRDPSPWPEFARHDPSVSITSAADLALTTVRALRHYEELGLLRPTRNGGNKRLFSPEQVGRARSIAELRRLGLGIQEIAEILDRGRGADRRRIREVFERRLADLKRQVAEMDRLIDQLDSPTP